MYLSKGTIYPRMPNTDEGVKLHKGIVYISAWGIYIAPPIPPAVWEVLDVLLSISEYGVTLTEIDYGVSFEVLEFAVSLEVEGMAIIGTTVRLKGTFTNLAGVVTDLDDPPVLNIYDGNRSLINNQTCTRESAGVYYYDYEIPDGSGPIFWEMSGLLVSLPVLSRSKMEREWA